MEYDGTKRANFGALASILRSSPKSSYSYLEESCMKACRQSSFDTYDAYPGGKKPTQPLKGSQELSGQGIPEL